ncbi:MAG: TylF/MycF/NovP-related O-methyltransferase [Bacteroidota bacterium]
MKILERIRLMYHNTLGANIGYILNPTFDYDGLVTNHVVPFLENRKFMAAFAEAQIGAEKRDDYYRAYLACCCADYALKLNGDFVECGVFHGVLASTISTYLEFGKREKKFYLFDTFEGLKVHDKMTDFERKRFDSQIPSYFEVGLYEKCVRKFSGFENVKLVKGFVPEILNSVPIKKVSFLHLDMNNHYPEIAALEHFCDKIERGGIVLFDDYCYSDYYKDTRAAVDSFLSKKSQPIFPIPTGQGIIVKY